VADPLPLVGGDDRAIEIVVELAHASEALAEFGDVWRGQGRKRSTDPVFQSECGSGKLTAREGIANTARLMENAVTCA
jgi:hypothetical protein